MKNSIGKRKRVVMELKKISVRNAIAFSFAAMLHHFFLYVSLLLVGAGMLAAIVCTCFLFDRAFFFFLLLVLIAYFLGFDTGCKKIALNIYDNKPATIKMIFSTITLLPKIFFSWLIYYILVSIGTACFIIPGIIVAIRLIFFPYFIVDKDCGPIEALTFSYKVTKGHSWDIIKLAVVVGIISAIGNVIIWPFSILAYTYSYRQLVPAKHV
jgi:uncharacterized membrane protein